MGPYDGVEWLVWARVELYFSPTGWSQAILVGGSTAWASAGGSWGWVWVVWPPPLGLGEPPGGVVPLPRSVRMHQRDCGTRHGSYIVWATPAGTASPVGGGLVARLDLDPGGSNWWGRHAGMTPRCEFKND